MCLPSAQSTGAISSFGAGWTSVRWHRALPPLTLNWTACALSLIHISINGKMLDIIQASKKELRLARQNCQMVFQDPYASLNPRQRVRDIIGEPLLVNGIARGKALEERVGQLMHAVGLPPDYMAVSYTHLDVYKRQGTYSSKCEYI